MADGGGDDVAKVTRQRRKIAQSEHQRFAKVPNEVILEGQLSSVALKLLAYRLTKVGDFVLHRTDVRKQILISKGAFYDAVNELCLKGLIERNQHPSANV